MHPESGGAAIECGLDERGKFWPRSLPPGRYRLEVVAGWSAFRVDQQGPQTAFLLGPPVLLGCGESGTAANQRPARVRAHREDLQLNDRRAARFRA